MKTTCFRHCSDNQHLYGPCSLAGASLKKIVAANQLKTQSGVYLFEIVPKRKVNNKKVIVGSIIIEFDGKAIATVDNLRK